MEGLVTLKKTVSYYRSSSKKQEHSVTMQRYFARAYCKERYFKLDYEFEDPYVSARTKKMYERPGLCKLLEAIRKDEIENLILYKRDRLARNVMEYMEIYELLQEKEIKVHFTTVGEPIMEYTPMNRYLELIMAGFAQHEGEQINKRFDAMRQSKFDAGRAVSSLPYGFKNNKKTKEIEMIENEVDSIKFIFNEFLDDACTSLKQIKNKLDAEGFKKRKGSLWETQDIRRTLENPFYMGTYCVRLKGVAQEQQLDEIMIIEPQEWDAVQEKLNRVLNKLGPRNKEEDPSEEHILYRMEGLLQCSYCKKPLEGVRKKKKGILLMGYQCNEHALYIDKDYIEEQTFDKMKQFFLTLQEKEMDRLFERYYKENVQKAKQKSQEYTQRLNRMNKNVHKKVQNWLKEKENILLQNQMLDSHRKVQEYKQMKEELEAKLHVLKKIPDQLKDLKDDIHKELVLDSLPDYKSIELFRDLIFTVMIDKHGYEIIFKNPFLNYQEVYTCENNS
ncbi:recombinase family protein [Bacillus paranthracis]